MLERQRLITAFYLKTREEEREMFCLISCNDIAGAMARYTDNVFGNHPADIFLRRMRAVTGSMSHCAGAARKARQRMFAMTAALGLPCVMFTVTPEDGINFRIRVMFKGEKGSETPPNFVLDEETLRTFISESEHIRFDHPGLCAIDFENVIGITVEHILGWDLNKNINKPGYGFFGDLDGWTYAVEEQGRQTLHAHFLLWIKGWGKLRSGLGTAKGHEEYVKQVSKYADRVMCTRLHGFSSRLVPKVCLNDCSNTVEGTEGYQTCTTQDLRQLRTKQGETSLGAKKILFCSVCKASLSSENVTLQRLKQYYEDALAGEDENFWSSSRYLTKCRVLMEMEVLHSMLPPKYAYVNVHSEFASILFGCNTNVITGVDGGSVMYCTCYVSKNTEKEDNKHFADAAKHMVKNMQQQMAERKELSDLELGEEASSVGLKGMIGAALMATKVHKVAAPMASYLIRNGSRFHFSHNFSYVDIGSFFKAIQEDLNISADEDGSVFLKSSVSNYLCRPKELEEVCVYDFESQYVACKPVTGSLEWAVPHPNNDHLKLNGCYLERWRKVYQDGKLSKKHEQFLMNIQDCRNSMNGGRPVDMIERLTVKPVTSRYNNGYDVEEEDGDDILNEAMDQFFLSESLELGHDNEFRDSRGRFQCQSILTRCHGSHRCGKNLVFCPNVQSSERFIVVEATETRPSETNETDFSTCNRHLNVKALNELALKVVTRVVDKNGRAIDMGVNGTLENVRAAAVSINGETTAKAFAFKREVRNELEEFKHAYLVIVDEISFASVEDVDVLNQKMKQILDNTMAPFGGVPVVFSGDFTQLSPVGGIPLYRRDEGAEWRQSINVFMELKTNHRFVKDLVWGKLLGRFRDHGPTTDEVATINAGVVRARNGPLEKNVPSDAVYATKTNVDRMAINDAIFVNHLEKTHFTDPNRQPPMHTLCIKAGNPRYHLTGTRKEYRVMENKTQDVMYAAVGEAHVSDKCKKYHDPLLKLYLGRPLCINQNEDVSSCIANGAMCEFRGVKLKPGASMDQFETIVIDGYYVNCVSVTQVESLLLKMLDGNAGEEGEHIIELNPKTIYALARFPVPCLGPITKKSMRTSRRISFDQFPINCANARTVHKLQGRSIKNLVVSAWDYTGKIYVCLSRCTTLHGLFCVNH
ncbi:PIF1-like helicase [Nitzschia inconspicua]|uniref:ATP-dependent DNA helicase n=1 Tax=Nitzschia inconspicua TaxID=303405 RepID=A0A9K3KSC7_9STRA|nr:PIF1-like helicase [Nitzschia inconspicua]